MSANRIYFERNQGEWGWLAQFSEFNLSVLIRDKIPALAKMRIIALVLTQRIFGPLKMWTEVSFGNDLQVVRHSTKILKWGMVIYSSQKVFELGQDGRSIGLKGEEYFWPLLYKSVPFKPCFGAVDDDSFHASYKMPMAGTFCDCQPFLGKGEGYMKIQTPWIKGRFELDKESKARLFSRF